MSIQSQAFDAIQLSRFRGSIMEVTDAREQICICGGKLRKECDSPIKIGAPYAPQDEIWFCPLCGKYFMKYWKAGDIDYYTEKADYFAVLEELKPTLRFCVSCKGNRTPENPLFSGRPVCQQCFIMKEWEDRHNRREVDRKFPSDTELHNFMAGERAMENRSYIEALEKLKPFADMGFSLAEYRLGEIYEKGPVDQQDALASLEWYKKAARKKFALAFSRIGRLYSDNHCVGINLIEAYKWFNLGAYFGDFNSIPLRDNLTARLSHADVLRAQEETINDLKKIWGSGDSRRKISDKLKRVYGELDGTYRYAEILDGRVFQAFVLDYRESERLYRSLAEDRYPSAMSRLGEKLIRGEGVEKNPEEAEKWLTSAISRNWLPAVELVWDEICAGSGLKLDREWARARFFDEIDSGNSKALYAWGMINFKGRGIARNFEEAHKWLNLAQYFGAKLPRPSPLEAIEREISFEQLETILKSTQQWLEEHQNKIRSIAKDIRNLKDRVKTEGSGKWFNIGEFFQYGKEGFLRHVILAYGCFDLALKSGNSAAASRIEYLGRILTSSKTAAAIEVTAAFVKTGQIPG